VKAKKLCNSQLEYERSQQPKQPDGNYITVKLGRISIDAIVDTGAAHSLLSETVAQILKLKIQPSQKHDYSKLTAANGSKVELIGTADLKLYIKRFGNLPDCTDCKATFPENVVWHRFSCG